MELVLLIIAIFFLSAIASHLLIGIIKIHIYGKDIKVAFRRDPHPFKPNQLWIIMTLMFLFWPWIDWEREVHYYKHGKPQWQRDFGL